MSINKRGLPLTDFHSHIVYGVDDGAKDEAATLEMLKIAEKSGSNNIVATPHFFMGRFEVTYGDIRKKVEKINLMAKENGIAMKVYCGQEVYYTNRILESYKTGDIGTINGSRYMLIELPMMNFSMTEVMDNIYELQIKGIVPIIAHPERYRRFIKEPQLINKLIKEGFLFQLNTGSLIGEFGKDVKKTAEIFVKHRIYSVIGSDGHRVKDRTADMKLGVLEIEKLQPGYIEEINKTGESILNNEETNFQGKKIEKKKGLLGFIKRK
ncbi:CpsB/CapC family capsule biosynthesis tyrosine phosphatase [Clostridium sp.]|uniref:tyrosine-protein phosphatase n=1 Tax=Clostridium sp. TaxID=1506 RepID=UPI003217E2C8